MDHSFSLDHPSMAIHHKPPNQGLGVYLPIGGLIDPVTCYLQRGVLLLVGVESLASAVAIAQKSRPYLGMG
jgi:hypothetical protein